MNTQRLKPKGTNTELRHSLRFLSNVDPTDVKYTHDNLDLEEILIVIISKIFTTAETTLNVRAMRQ